MPAPSRAFELGQWATPVPVSPKRATSRSLRCTQWASHTSSPSQPSCSRYSTGRQPNCSRQNASSSTVSARWVCRRTPRRRASSAVSRISSPVTENGEHGASATRSIAPGRRVVEAGQRVLAGGQDRVAVLDHLVGRQAAAASGRGPSSRGRDGSAGRARGPPRPRWPGGRRRRAGRRSGGRCSSSSPERASAASPARAAARSTSSSTWAQTGYRATSHSNSVASWARPRVAHWYRWWWQFTRPGVARQPPGVDPLGRHVVGERRRAPRPHRGDALVLDHDVAARVLGAGPRRRRRRRSRRARSAASGGWAQCPPPARG